MPTAPLASEIANTTILVVDDNPTNLNVLVDYLKDSGFKLLIARDGEAALARAQLALPDLILLDVMMPGMDGFEVCQRLKANPAVCDIPVIFMTALASTDDKVRGFNAGAVDYVTKPVQQAEVLARVSAHLRLRALTQQLQQFNATLEAQVQARTAELQTAYAKLEKLDRHKADFINIAAHELRTPLAVIKGYAQLLSQMGDDRPETQEMLETLLGGANRLAVIINAMLDIARLEGDLLQLRPTSVRSVALWQAVQHGLTPALTERCITLTLAATLHTLPAIQADAGLLQKVFYHLLVNAIKYTPDGGRITVAGQATADPAGVEIMVADTGIGIDPANRELIFEKFFQTGQVALHSSGPTKFKGGGSGLGLSIARGIMQAHHGRLWVESPGYDETACPGSTFHVWLPM